MGTSTISFAQQLEAKNANSSKVDDLRRDKELVVILNHPPEQEKELRGSEAGDKASRRAAVSSRHRRWLYHHNVTKAVTLGLAEV